MGFVEGKRLLVTGVITDQSIGFAVAKLAQENGATVVLTGFGRMSLVERIAKRLPSPPPVIELDVTNQEHLDSLASRVGAHVDGLDGVLHSIGFAPASCLVFDRDEYGQLGLAHRLKASDRTDPATTPHKMSL